MVIFEERVYPFRSPRGHPVQMLVRDGTNDWNTTNACLAEDEYGLRDEHPSGWALDVGAYTGGVTVGLLVDNPGLRVVAIEPVPENADLIRRNLSLNGLGDRGFVVGAAAGSAAQRTTEIRWRYEGDDALVHHAFVGNTSLVYERGGDLPHQSITVPVWTYGQCVVWVGSQYDLVKVDAEGAEYGFLTDPGVGRVPVIMGEWHPVPWEGKGRTRQDIIDLLSATHDVTFTGPEAGPGGFRAVRR